MCLEGNIRLLQSFFHSLTALHQIVSSRVLISKQTIQFLSFDVELLRADLSSQQRLEHFDDDCCQPSNLRFIQLQLEVGDGFRVLHE